ncbi:hypothetical protein Loa_01744 [Legionella oakridgensis ATCC 33761 = DSM 21215]|uniref:Uncharacterized protein n=1 Tax=Legionella oakridgensis ATCC 33761 = DSM 21215 TaxID=1268635 RepID=W0BF51_9GAMM|nr:hypothetical protein Loa_01744 [Legionella oakridgensis ATCC 33761 = DSM 21215]ETO93101.1 hypothetical protein LOR_28c02360 [Legionella oakridgensis RV-2-2007]STY20357.1 Uncharacterised protein [Legionella longbeachae]
MFAVGIGELAYLYEADIVYSSLQLFDVQCHINDTPILLKRLAF